MHVTDAVKNRRTIRHFLPDDVPSTVIRDILSLASMAPNIGNRQFWRFIVVTDVHFREMLLRTVNRKLDELERWPESDGNAQRLRVWRESSTVFSQAPATIFVINQGYHLPVDEILVSHGYKTAEIGESFGYPSIQSISCVIAYLTLLAEEREYGTCWMTNLLLAQRDLAAVFDLRAGEKIVAAVALGKPAEHPVPKDRKAIDDLIEWR